MMCSSTVWKRRRSSSTPRLAMCYPAAKALAGAGVEMIDMEGRQFLLKRALDRWRSATTSYSSTVPPSLELLTLNALCAADSLLVPLQGEYALEGLSDLMGTVRIVRRGLNPKAGDRGCAADHVRRAHQSGHQVAQEIKRFFPERCTPPLSPGTFAFPEAPSHGKAHQRI